ncbi:MAG: RHS repeat protein, partial [Clostridiales bacterium]|nr:RHS repeat protein [Clostridiales bacterium]
MKSIPEKAVSGIINNAGTFITPQKAYDFFLNPDASLASNLEYMSAAISTGMTAYGGGKLLQSGHQFLKGIHISAGNMGTVTYEYDIIEGVGAGETAERTTDPKGNVTTKIYDRAGRLKAVIDGDISSTDITTYEYYANGSRLSVTYPTGIKEEYT